MTILPSVRQLRHAVALYETQSFSKAADMSFVAQSSLSTSIKELEDILGVSLFERTTRKVLPTQAGESFILKAKLILRDMQDAVEETQNFKKSFSGDLRLGTIPTIGPYLLPKFLDITRKNYPGYRIYIQEDQTENLLNKLEQGSLDILILALPVDTRDFVVGDFLEDPLYLLCYKDHALSQQQTITRTSLSHHDLLLLEDGHCLRNHALSMCSISYDTKHDSFQATSLKTLLYMIESNLGISLIPKMAVHEEVKEESDVVVKEFSGSAPKRQIALVWRKTSSRRAEFEELLLTCKNIFSR